MEEQTVNEQAAVQPLSAETGSATDQTASATDQTVTVAGQAVGEARAKSNKKVLIGQVVSNKMDKTAVVLITKRRLHRLYKKYITESKKIKVHDQQNECGIGDTVRVVECRPLSRDKRWRLLEIVTRAK